MTEYFKSGQLREIEEKMATATSYEDWKEADTILHPYKLKRYNEFGQIKSIGIVKPLAIEDDSDFFNIDGRLSSLEIFAYNKSFGQKFIKLYTKNFQS